jgi:nucleotide-binding universal stress UspA family protein
MRGFENLLLPVDFSECTNRICTYAIDIAEKFNARLHVLFVVEIIPYMSLEDGGAAALMDVSRQIVSGAENEMEGFCERYLEGVLDYEAKVVIGNPAEKIIRYTIEVPIDLIIMGTHSKKGLDRIFRGSVSEQVLKYGSVPVFTINPFRTKVQYIHT